MANPGHLERSRFFTGRTGGREVREARILGFALPPAVGNHFFSGTSGKYFLIRASESENAFSPPQTSRPAILPVISEVSARASSTTAARGARSFWPCDATEASASDLRRGSHKFGCFLRVGGPYPPPSGFALGLVLLCTARRFQVRRLVWARRERAYRRANAGRDAGDSSPCQSARPARRRPRRSSNR